MLKKCATVLLAIIIALAMFPTGQQAEAATTYTFVKAQYSETENKDGSVTRTLKSISLKKSNGTTGVFQVAANSIYYINDTLTTIAGFKNGMPVTIKLSNGKIKEMRGTTNIEDGSIVSNSKQLSGSVTSVDPNGLQIRVKVDGSSTNTFVVTNNTEVFKDNSSVDISTIYVGDRVRLKFETATTSRVSEIHIISTAVMVEDLYKANLNTVNTTKNTMVVKNAHPLLNWRFGTEDTIAQQTFTLTNNTSIYVGNKKISKSKLMNYKNSDLYFVTKKQFSKEVVEKIIVLAKNERTYYQPIEYVSLDVNTISLKNVSKVQYHEGSILIRNGRLVEPEGLIALNTEQTPISTTAFVLTDGATKNDYAHIVNITNDGFLAPNLSEYGLYFARIDVADMGAYQLELTDIERFNNHFWKTDKSNAQFAFSNSTVASELDGSSNFKVIPELDLDLYDNYTNSPNPYYGYFYEKDGHIQGIHFVPGEKLATLTLTGRVDDVNYNTKKMSVKNSSQWNKDGSWSFRNGALTLDLSKAMIVKNGKVITIKDIKKSDHITAIARSTSDVYVLMVSE
ncbi:phosphate ABC transporter ATPase [Solibacillus sp. MA9]|uniref:Phosphate ABC transporter ATPase n=1 Tax=Solibacillus palustris TaxID=2908203 RepID=A0ABS9UD40_9BACL|nr:phosphate ABC transporter ATPase [Solibacillus sp. MA9]MCH7322257.1 phosphate ABC transporter ATPase [Solibacillus sp. MA9]